MIEPIIPAVLEVRGSEGDMLDNAIRANVSRVVKQLRTTTDPLLRNWSAPQRAFSGGARAVNPVPCNASSCVQWQPNLFALRNGRLGCVWSGSDGTDGVKDPKAQATFFSTLAAPGGKWTNAPLLFVNGTNSTAAAGAPAAAARTRGARAPRR